MARHPNVQMFSGQLKSNNKMEFGPRNKVVAMCVNAMGLEEAGNAEAAKALFRRAWSQAAHDLEKFFCAYFLARTESECSAKLKWLETALQAGLRIKDSTVFSAFPLLYSSIAKCQEDLGRSDEAHKNYELARSAGEAPADKGPFYHGTRADLRIGDFLTAGGGSNYEPGLKMNHVYFTARVDGAGLAAALAKGDRKERVYIVEPTGRFEDDPNVTNKKFPGNPTRSYRSTAPLRIVGEVPDWVRQTSQNLESWRQRLSRGKGKIIN